MSLLAETMEALKYAEAQNKLILAGNLPNAVLAERFGKSVRQIQRQRAFLKGVKRDEQSRTNA
ncbi:MAG: hypothetical protein [Bacteriophage sp.]|nr:MAG: hypothetical protein [Bacteriophage sp.]